MSEKYDIVIVGAGPAGAMTALAAAKGGAKVLMLDKRRELGVPVQCGEALSEDILKQLKIKPDPNWALNRIRVAKIIAPGGLSVTMAERAGGKVGYILDRKIFDKELALMAVKSGADIKVGTFVEGLITENGKIQGVKARSLDGKMDVHADIVVAADGVMSRVARWAGIKTTLRPKDLETCAQFKMTGIKLEREDQMEYYMGSKVTPGGYAWIFPRGGGTANIGLGVLADRVEKAPLEYLKKFVNNHPLLKNGRIFEINVGGVSVCKPLKETAMEKLLVVGDAARMVNPLTGGGIDSAMRAGTIAGEVAAKAIKDGDTSKKRLNEYDKLWRDAMEDRLKKYLKAKDVLLDLTDEELDKLAKALQGIEFDRISLTELVKILVKTNPKLLLKLKGMF